ncbi:PAS domain-containing sensor histidine kinase [Pedobacter sp. L105]|uniref:PAS domain-containing sensor histidine kinase n=1 Tax=Pedobacter sp. L105 TaxID=1641871 RepID=UPI00131DAA8E|nr:PAS domain-containing sensor histidine kinase [Pedobacter sp. L105]
MENAALLVAIIKNAIDGIITINDQGMIESINPSACKLFKYAPEEVIGKNVTMLLPPSNSDDPEQHIPSYKLLEKSEEKAIEREVIGLKKDNTLFPFRIGISDVQYSGRKIYTGFIHDLSREKEAEEKLKDYTTHLEELVEVRTHLLKDTIIALQKAKEEVIFSLKKEKELGQLKSRFVSMASHEFRTPLSVLQLSATLIDEYTKPFNIPKVNKHVGKIKNVINELTTILDDFLSLEKLEAGRIEPVFNSFNMVELAEEVQAEMQMLAKQNQTIIYDHSGSTSMLNLDHNLLKHCIINLITNAIKYSGENTRINFKTEVNDQFWTISVKDQGIGIPKADQKHLFEPFFRAHNIGNIQGTGLGLNIVARYTQLMNGTIIYKSSMNKGTTFKLSFARA